MSAPAPTTCGAPDVDALRASRRAVVVRLLLPRGLETTSKWLLIPVGGLLAVSVRAALPTVQEVAHFVLLWFVAEQLAYQARYQLNDLRDRRIDAGHPARAQRGRLSFPWTRTRATLVWSSVVARVVLSVLLVALALDGPAREAGMTFLVGVVLVSGAYELARERVRREHVDPLSARATTLGLPVLLCVPLGYGLRVWTGFHALATGTAAELEVLLVLAVLALYAGTVLLAWALEGTSFVQPDGTGHPALGDRAHLALLVRHTGLLDPVEPTRDRPAAVHLVLARDRPARGPADLKVWDAAAAAALVLAYATAARGAAADGTTTSVLAGAAVVSVVLPLLLRRRLTRSPGRWDVRPPWLGHGALAVTVAVELTALLVAAAVVLLHDARQARLLWLPAFFLFTSGSVRASSYVRGFGPLSPLKRPVAWLRRRRAVAA